MDERLLKRALTKYNENKKIKQDLEWRLEEAEARLNKAGNWVAKIPDGSPPNAGLTFVVKMEICDKIRVDLKRVNDEIKEVDDFITKMSDYKNLIEDKFINNLGGDELADKYGYSRQHIYKLIDRLLLTGAMLDKMIDD